MDLSKEERKKRLIERICKQKKMTIEQATEYLAVLETYCELVIKHVLFKGNE
jgi:hypothetical protein